MHDAQLRAVRAGHQEVDVEHLLAALRAKVDAMKAQWETEKEAIHRVQTLREALEHTRRHIAEAGYDPVYGARPLKRYLQRQLESRLGRAIVAGEVTDGSHVTVTAADGELHIETHAPEAADEPAERPAEEA